MTEESAYWWKHNVTWLLKCKCTVTTRRWKAAHTSCLQRSSSSESCLYVKKKQQQKTLQVLVGRSIFSAFNTHHFMRVMKRNQLKHFELSPNYSNQVGKEYEESTSCERWNLRATKVWDMIERQSDRNGGSTITHVTDWVSMGPLCALAGACHLSRWVRVWMVTERCNGGDMSVGWVPERFQLLVMTNSYQVMAERLARFPRHKEKGHVWSLKGNG